MNEFINLATKYTIAWIRTEGKRHFKSATTVEELKKLISNKLFGLRVPNAGQVKGLRLVNWEAVFKAVSMMCFLFSVGLVQATDVTLTYTITSKYAGRSSVISSPKTKKGDTSAGVSKEKIQNISVLDATRPVKNQTANLSENTQTRKTARINPSKNDILALDIVSSKPTPRNEIEQKVCEIFGSDCHIALAICKAESGCREEAIGDGHLTFEKDGVEYGKSYGVFQIRHLPGRPSPSELLNADFNIEYAYKIFKSWGGYNAWSVYTSGKYLDFL